jgi:Fe-S cluster assembly iron-binding protein IscA
MSQNKEKSRTIKNKCVRVKIEVEGVQYRCLSFFIDSPEKCQEEDWSIFTMENEKKILIDKLSLAILAECECEFLSRQSDKQMDEPPIVAVELVSLTETAPQSPKSPSNVEAKDIELLEE